MPDNITLLIQPPYAPELNPVENVWQYLRQNKLAHRVFQTYEEIVDACSEASADFTATPDRIASITRREWANVS